MTDNSSATQKPSIEEGYKSVKGLICKLVYGHKRKYGGELDDLMGRANLHFTEAFRCWDPSKSKLATWVTIYVSGLLKSDKSVRQDVKFRKKLEKFPPSDLIPITRFESLTKNKNTHGVEHSNGLDFEACPNRISDRLTKETLLASTTSEDVKVLIKLTFDPPPDVVMAVRNSKSTSYAIAFKKAMLTWLSEVGWATERILEGFAEVKKLLSE